MDVERTMEFILDQQAKFWAGMQEMREDQAELRKRQADLSSLVVRLAEQQLGLAQHFDQFQQETRTALLAVAEAQRHTDERLHALIEAQHHTDGRLDALIAVVDGGVRRKPKP